MTVDVVGYGQQPYGDRILFAVVISDVVAIRKEAKTQTESMSLVAITTQDA